MLPAGGRHLPGDAVQVPLSLRSQLAPPVLVLLDHLERLQRLQDAAGDGAGAAAEVAGPDPAALPPPVHLREGPRARPPPQVEVPRGGGSAGVEPVLIVAVAVLH